MMGYSLMCWVQLIHNAGELAVEKYEKIAKDHRIHGVLQLLDNEVIRIVTAAQPKVVERSSIIRPSPQIGNSPGSSHLGQRAPGVTLNQSPGFGQSYGGLSADFMNLATGMPMPMEIADVAWSPALADEIGWDWGDFLPLYSEPHI